MTNTVFVNSTNITTNIETAALSRVIGQRGDWSQLEAKVKVKRNVCVRRVWVKEGFQLKAKVKVKVKVGEERWGGCRGDGLHAGASELGSQS